MNLKKLISGNHRGYRTAEGEVADDRRQASGGWDHPFWRVMGFIFAGLLGIAVWLGKNTVDKLQSINDTQIEMKVQLENLVTQAAQDQGRLTEIGSQVQSLQISNSLHQQEIDDIKTRLGVRR